MSTNVDESAFDASNIVFDHDEERQTFEAIIGDDRAILEYRSNKEGKIFLNHTEVPPQLQGKGIAGILVQHVFDHIRDNNMRMIPRCPYIKSYLKKHPENMDLVASGIRIT